MNLRSTAIDAARQIKHFLWVASKRCTTQARVLRDDFYVASHRFTWEEHKFYQSHAGRTLDQDPRFSDSESVPRIIFGIWSGQNDMSSNRKRGWESVQRLNPEIECVLVTPSNLADYIREDMPLHPAYDNLSLVHRSDYLRAYLMNSHGGGYTDIKPARHPWLPMFQRLDESTAWAIGFRESGHLWIGDLPKPIGDLPRRYHHLLIADQAFIMRPHSPLTTLWMDEVNRRLEYYADDLARFPGNTMGDNQGYPIRWTGILGDVNGGILLRYHKHLLQDPRLRPEMENYR